MVPLGITSATVVRRTLGIRIRNLRGRFRVALASDAYEIEDAAAFIFAAIDGRSSAGAIAGRLAQRYAIPAPQAVGDTVEFLTWLADRGLVEVSDPPGDPRPRSVPSDG